MLIVHRLGHLVIWLMFAAWASVAHAELTVDNLTLVSQERVGRTLIQFNYRADITNTGTAVENAVATVSSSAVSTVVVESELVFGNVDADATVTSTDTFTIRQDRRLSFDPSSLSFTVLAAPVDNTLPDLSIVSPADGALTIENPPLIEVTYADDSDVDSTSLVFTANGQPLDVNCQFSGNAAQCTLAAPLDEGDNSLSASISDVNGNVASASSQFTIDSLPVEVNISSPANGFVTLDEQVLVQGAIGAGVDSVSINGIDATVSNGNFSATVPLREGVNMLVALATKGSDRTGTSTVDVTRDIVAPNVSIDSPRDGFISFSNTVAITGKVNDIVTGGINPRVFVNGIEATVGNGTFLVIDFPLLRGSNRITAIGIDSVGNQGSATTNVEFRQTTGARLGVVSGNGQASSIKEQLAQPLIVEVSDELGNPVAGRVLNFEISRSSGLLKKDAADIGKRSVQVPTDGSGRASVLMLLGVNSGEGNNRVRVTGQGVSGEVEFCASALPTPPDKVLMVDGDNQRGVVGHPLDTPFEALVADKDGNPVPGIDVIFSVIKGKGSIDSQQQVVKTTNVGGIARVVLTLSSEPGINNNVVSATVSGSDSLPATFVASGLAPGRPEETRFSGVVLDNSLTPIAGSVISISDSSVTAVTDEEGQFLLENVPVGRILLHIDPTASPRPETFPLLNFETVTVAGQNNILGQPILLPTIDAEASIVVGGDEDVTLKMVGVAGLELTVFANSATFPDGSQVGELSISQVHLDKVPMPPPSGTFFMPPAWTIQPTGTLFDPPARISIPNDGLEPGRVIDIFQFDHTLNEFINIGKGTVSEDGSVIVSDPGFGVTRAGWGGCGQPPPPDTCADSCDDGEICNGAEQCENGSCVAGSPPPPETPRAPQTPGNCQDETCGGSEPNDGDVPEDTAGDCQASTCENGSPSSEDDDSDVPEDTSGDCQASTCENGSPSSEDDDSDVPENTSGDCQAPTCENGSPSSEDDNGDIPANTSGDCQAPICENGSPSSEDDNGDIPANTARDCQAPICENGSPSSQPDDSDVPEDTAGDCQAPICQGGAPSSVNDDSDVREDTAGDCQAPICQGGAPSTENDDSDAPEDTPGDCRAAICLNGAASTKPDDSDKPTDICKLCENGAIKSIDTTTWKDDASVSASVTMPPNIKDRVQSAIRRIPKLGGVTLNEVKAGITGQTRDCCDPATGVVPNGVKQGAGTGSLSVELKNIQIWPPFPGASFDQDFLIDEIPGTTILIELVFAPGVFFDSNFAVGGQIGLRSNACENIDCLFGQIDADVFMRLKAQVEAIGCVEVDSLLGTRKDCVGFSIVPAAVSLSVNGNVGWNVKACGNGASGTLAIGDVFFEASAGVGLPGVGDLSIKIKVINGFTVF